MPSDERLLNQGRLVEAEQKAKGLAIKIHGLKEQLRRQSDPHRRIEDLDVSAMRVTIDGLAEANMQYERLLQEIATLREDLGLPRYEPR